MRHAVISCILLLVALSGLLLLLDVKGPDGIGRRDGRTFP